MFWSESCAHPKRVQSQTKKGQTVALKLSSLACDPPAQCSVDLVRNDKFYWQVTIMRSNSACLLKIYFLIDQPKVALKPLKFAFKIIYHPMLTLMAIFARHLGINVVCPISKVLSSIFSHCYMIQIQMPL